ncbi:MAG TPA: lamin tail domain-containing protein, partial [Patescibacteria group bacterium]
NQPNSETPVRQAAGFSAGDILINEFVADPGDNETEWVELRNMTHSIINLESWTVADGSGKITELAGLIEPENYFVIEKPKGVLNNTGDLIILKFKETVIDRVAYGDWDDGDIADNAPKAADPNSVARTDFNDADHDFNDFQVTTTPTKGGTNIISAPIISEEKNNSSETLKTPPPVDPTIYKHLIINEFLPNPAGPDATDEFIELKNNGSGPVDIENLIIQDNSSKKHKINQKDFDSTLIQPGGFFVINRSVSGIALNNTGGDAVKLFSPDELLIEQIDYFEKAEEGLSYSRDQDDDWFWTAAITPGAANSLPELITIEEPNPGSADESIATAEPAEKQTDYPPIMITEVLPNPAGSDSGEWLELYNPNDFEIDLTGWRIDDEEGGSRPHKIKDTVIGPRQYLVLPRQQTKLALNNSGDSVRLFDPNNTLIDLTDYEAARENSSWALSDDYEWSWTANLTPQDANIFTQPATAADKKNKNKQIIQTTLKQARENDPGDLIQVEGIVSVEPGILGSQIFYVAGSGMQIFMSKKDFPDLKVGDRVQLTGELSQIQGETRLKIAAKEDIILIAQAEPPQPEEILTGDVSEELEGYLVTVEGELLETKSRIMYLDDGSEEVTVYVKSSTGLPAPKYEPGTTLKISGIVSQTKTGYRILPRYASDIKVVSAAMDKAINETKLENSDMKTRVMRYLIASIAASIIILIIIKLKSKNQNGK